MDEEEAMDLEAAVVVTPRGLPMGVLKVNLSPYDDMQTLQVS